VTRTQTLCLRRKPETNQSLPLRIQNDAFSDADAAVHAITRRSLMLFQQWRDTESVNGYMARLQHILGPPDECLTRLSVGRRLLAPFEGGGVSCTYRALA